MAPFVMQSDLGVEYNVLQVSPKRMLRRLKEAASRWGWKKVFVGKGYGDEEAASMAARVHGEWHRTALHGMHDATPEERGAARAVMDGSAWTEARCCQAGYIEFPLCKWCQLAVGTMKHRLFKCQRLEEVEGKSLARALREQGGEAAEGDPYWTELVPLGDIKPALPIEANFGWIEAATIFTGEVFGDGSAKGIAGMKRGGVGVWHVENRGRGAVG